MTSIARTALATTMAAAMRATMTTVAMPPTTIPTATTVMIRIARRRI